jgi:hypothetical protein
MNEIDKHFGKLSICFDTLSICFGKLSSSF